MKRRDFIKTTTALGIGLTLSSKAVFASESKKELLPKKQTRVAIIGGGFGGATTAKYIKMLNPKLDVVLIDQHDIFYSCPMSNHVIVGLSNIKEISFKYDILQKKYGVKFLKKEVENIDGVSKKVLFKDGFLTYDILVVSPGIGFKYDEAIGYTKDVAEVLPHAWKAGEQTLKLAKMLKELPKGGTVLLRVPKSPYRCPPGPYERSCLIAWYLKTYKPGSKILVIDKMMMSLQKGNFSKLHSLSFIRISLNIPQM